MRRLFFLLSLLPAFCYAANDTLFAFIENGQPCIHHSITTKQNLFRIAKHYQVVSSEIKRINSGLSDTLKVSRKISIPLTTSNFTYDVVATGSAAEVSPVYYTVRKGEKMSQVSAHFFDVPAAVLVKLNKLKSPLLTAGQTLKVGWLLTIPYVIPGKDPAIKTSLSQAREKELPVSTGVDPVSINPLHSPEIQEVKKGGEDVNPIKLKVETATNRDSTQYQTEADAVTQVDPSRSPFYMLYIQKAAMPEDSTQGPALKFNATDGSNMPQGYYALHNRLPIGSIVKVKFMMNGNIVYVKILGKIPDILGNQNSMIKLSSRAADDLGLTDERSLVQIWFHAN